MRKMILTAAVGYAAHRPSNAGHFCAARQHLVQRQDRYRRGAGVCSGTRHPRRSDQSCRRFGANLDQDNQAACTAVIGGSFESVIGL
jgi:hypothetical protein